MTPIVTLGVCAYTHDSAAALLVDGALVGFCEEERFDGVKHSNAYPRHAVGWLLEHAGLRADQITHVAYNFNPALHLRALRQLPRHLLHPATATRAVPRAASFVKVARRGRRRLGRFRRAAGIGLRPNISIGQRQTPSHHRTC